MKISLVPSVFVLMIGVFANAAATAPTLIEATRNGDTATALALLDKSNVNERSIDGTSALHWAIHRDDVMLVEQLIKAGANVTAANDYGATPMSAAAVIANTKVIGLLLKAGADAESANAEGQTALMAVARTGHVDTAKRLIKHGANVNAVEKWRGQTALMWAAAEGHSAMVKELLKHRADANARSLINSDVRQITSEPRMQARPSGGFTPLLYAARQGCVECTQWLIDAGANMNLADPDGVTPMIMAINNFHFDVAALLLKKGADANKWDWWGRSPLYSAVDMNVVPAGGRPDRPSLDNTTSLKLIQLLLEAGANPNMQLKLFPPYRAQGPDRGADGILTTGATALLVAAKNGDVPAIRLLLAHGANIQLTPNDGLTPLLAAAGVGSLEIDTRGHFKTEQQAVESIDLLIKAGANVNETDRRGRTALHGAAHWGWNEAVKFLVARGANLNAKDAGGKTPLDEAMGRGAGHGRGQSVMVFEETGKLIEQLMAQR